MSPTGRTLAKCKKLGWRAHVVERRVPFRNTTIDLFGFIDIVALDGQPGVLGIQATSTAHGAERVRKIVDTKGDAARDWLKAGNRIEVWGWAKRGPRGKQKRWQLNIYPVTAEVVA